MIPRFGESPRPDQTYRLRPGVYAVLLRGDQVLLTFQSAPHFEYQLPGGGIDPGEQPLPALHREVREETGWAITAPRRIGAFRRFTFMPEYGVWAEKLCTIYTARPLRPLGPPSEPGHRAEFLPARLALSLLANAGDQALLARALAAG